MPAPNGIYVYGNIFRATRAAGTEGTTNPTLLSSTSGDQLLNVFIYNNTCYNLQPLVGGYQDSGVLGGPSSSTVTVQNNIWQNCTYAPGFGGVGTQDHNMLNTGGASFANAAGGNFHLTANTAAGVNLGSPYNVDPDGVTRTTWSMGAYEYNPGGGGSGGQLSVSLNSAYLVLTNSYSFGSSPTNVTITNTLFTVQNVGTGTLVGTSSVAAPFFILSGGTYSLPQNQSQVVTVQFKPAAISNYSRTISFSAAGGAGTNITLLGSGTASSTPASPQLPVLTPVP